MISSSCFKGECRLQMEAQRISLSQIHTAQFELLQEETDARTRSLELQLQGLKDRGAQGEQIESFVCICVCGKAEQQSDGLMCPPRFCF